MIRVPARLTDAQTFAGREPSTRKRTRLGGQLFADECPRRRWPSPAQGTVSPVATGKDIQASRRPTVVRAAWLFDGTSSALTADPAVVVEAGRIKAVSTGTAAIPDDAEVVNLGVATLLPGLVDSHLHLCLDASEDPVGHLADVDDEALLRQMAAAARRALAAGVTTVRDLGDRNYLALRLREQTARLGPLPTIVAAGPPITTPRGHCHFLGGAAHGTAGIRAAVAERAERGADVIKIMASGGNLTPGSSPHQPQFGLEELQGAVDEAHRHGLPITAHAHSARSIADAVTAGVDGLEHATFMTADGVDAPDELIRQIAARRIAIGATVARRPDPSRQPPPAIASRIEGLLANHRRLHESGARMVASTDAGSSPVMPHDALPWAPDQLAELGFGAAEALWAITSRAAQVCGLGHRKGRVTAGYDADLVAVYGNPLTDASALRRACAVLLGGEVISRPRPSRSESGHLPGTFGALALKTRIEAVISVWRQGTVALSGPRITVTHVQAGPCRYLSGCDAASLTCLPCSRRARRNAARPE